MKTTTLSLTTTPKGLRADERVAQVNTPVNFATSTDPIALRKGAIQLRDVLKLQNYQYGQQTGMFPLKSCLTWNNIST